MLHKIPHFNKVTLKIKNLLKKLFQILAKEIIHVQIIFNAVKI